MEDVDKELKRIVSKRNYQEKHAEMTADVLGDTDAQAFLNAHREELIQADIEKGCAKLYELVREKRKYQENDPAMIAPRCEPKLTLSFHYVDVTHVSTETLSALQRQEEIGGRMKAIDMPEDIQSTSFENFEHIDGRGYTGLEALDFVEKCTADPKGRHKDLCLMGSFGIRKTYLLGATAGELAVAGFTMTLVHFPTFVVEMKQAVGKDQVIEKLDAVKRFPILMVDDTGADVMSSWIRSEIFGVVL